MAVGLSLLVSLMLIAFSLPLIKAKPHDVGLAVVGPAPMVEQIVAGMEARAPGTFAIQAADNLEQATVMVSNREVYGAIALRPGMAPEVVIATMASQPAALAIQGMAQGMATAAGMSAADVSMTDVAPMPEKDPRGIGLIAAGLPLLFGGMIIGIAASLAVVGLGQKLLTVVLGAVFVSGAVIAILHGWYGSLAGNYWAEWGTIAMGMSAMAFGLVGMNAVLGRAGIGIFVVTVMLIGNPLSGAATGPEFVPAGWSTLGQMLPPGAVMTAVKSVTAFGGAGSAGAFTVLTIWALGGLALLILGSRKKLTN